MTGGSREGPAVDLSGLMDNQLLSQLDAQELNEVRRLSRRVTYERDEVVFDKHDPGDSLYVILSGRIGIHSVSSSGKQIFLNVMESGDVLGEIALLDGRERTAGAVAMEHAELLRIDRADFIPFLERHPKLCLRLMSVLCERIRWTSSIIESVVFLDIPRRVARRLLDMAREMDTSTAGGRVNVGLSQEDLANMLGTSRESVNKVLRSLQRQGVIRYDRSGIVIRDADHLEALASEAI